MLYVYIGSRLCYTYTLLPSGITFSEGYISGEMCVRRSALTGLQLFQQLLLSEFQCWKGRFILKMEGYHHQTGYNIVSFTFIALREIWDLNIDTTMLPFYHLLLYIMRLVKKFR